MRQPASRHLQTTTKRIIARRSPQSRSLYLTALEQQMPVDQINELIRIFAFGLDLQGPRRAIPSSCSTASPRPMTLTPSRILFASVTTGGTTTTYYRFQTPDGVTKYYDADGFSADNFLLRKPMSGGELHSQFGNRLHQFSRVPRLRALIGRRRARPNLPQPATARS